MAACDFLAVGSNSLTRVSPGPPALGVWSQPVDRQVRPHASFLWIIFTKTASGVEIVGRFYCPSMINDSLALSQLQSQFLKRWEYQTTLPAPREICMQVKKQLLGLDMDQQTGSKLGKEYIKAVYCHPACLTSMQSTSYEMPGWMKYQL